MTHTVPYFRSARRPLYALAALFMFWHASAQAQTVTGSVRDEHGHALPHANVRIEGGSIGAATDKEGIYALKNLPAGTHRITASMVGFATQTKSVAVPQNSAVTLDFVLEETAYETEQVVVSGGRREQLYKEAPVKVQVISNDVFERMESASLLEGLSFKPGMRVETNCQNCGFSQVRINGLDGSYSQILIDSRPVFGSLAGVYGLEQLPASMIDRVEIVRGGGSSLFGGNAVAGTINVITKEPRVTAFEFGTSTAFLGGKVPDRTVNAGASFSSGDEAIAATAFGFIRDRNHYDHDGDGYSEITALQNQTLGGRAVFRPSESGKLTADFHAMHEIRRGGNRFDVAPHEADIAERLEHHVYNAGTAYEHAFDGGDRASVYASFGSTRRDSYYGIGKDPNAYGNSANDILIGGAQYTHVFESFLSGDAVTVAGTEYTRDVLKDDIPGYGHHIDQLSTQWGWYVQHDTKLREWVSVILGARADKHSLLDAVQLNPRASVMLRPRTNVALRMTYSTGFRPPATFDEDLHLATVGGDVRYVRNSPGLMPESSQSFSGALDWDVHFGEWEFVFTLDGFHTRLENAFVLEDAGMDAGGRALFERRNGGNAAVTGGGLEIDCRILRTVAFQAGLTVQRSMLDEPMEWAAGRESRYILRTPEAYGYLTGTVTATDRMDVSLSAVYTGPMWLPHYAGYIAESALERSAPFLDMTLRAGYKIFLDPGVEVYAGMYNLLDMYQKDIDRGMYRDAGYVYGPQRPRSVFGGINILL